MRCQLCRKADATVHVTEIVHFPDDGGVGDDVPVLEEKHVCDACARKGKIPYSGVGAPGMAMLDMLKESARRMREESTVSCPDCGMTLLEFRSKGRLGCPRDYEIFAAQLDPLLLRIHNANRHRGDAPLLGAGETGAPPETAEPAEEGRQEHLTTLRAKLEEAIQSEAYESAAKIRDLIQELEQEPER